MGYSRHKAQDECYHGPKCLSIMRHMKKNFLHLLLKCGKDFKTRPNLVIVLTQGLGC